MKIGLDPEGDLFFYSLNACSTCANCVVHFCVKLSVAKTQKGA